MEVRGGSDPNVTSRRLTKPWKDQELIEAVREAFRRYAESLSSDTPA